MGILTNGFRAAWMVAGLMLVTTPAWAQLTQFPSAAPATPGDRPARPFRPLFGPESTGRQSLHTIDLSLAFEGAADNALFNDTATGPAPSVGGGDYNQAYTAGASLAYARNGQKLTLGASVGTFLPYYPVLPDASLDPAYSAHLTLGAKGRRTSLTGGLDYSRFPYYTFVFDSSLTSGGLGGPLDFSAAATPLERASVNATLRQEFGRKTSGAVSYGQSAGLFEDESRDTRNRSASASLERQQTRSIKMTAGYSVSAGSYDRGDATTSTNGQGGDIAILWAPRPRRGRSTSLSASAGLYSFDNGSGPMTRMQWALRAQRTITGTWSAGAEYSRRLRAYDILSTPTWADVVSAQISGQPHRRVNLGVSANYSEDLDSARESIRFVAGTVRFRFALTNNAALDVGGTYVNYRFPEGYDLPAGMWLAQERVRAQIGLSLWIPVARFGRARSGGAVAGQ
jgi:hypothetical protein